MNIGRSLIARISRNLALALALALEVMAGTGCTVMRPLDEGSWRFLMGRSYSSTEYQTTFITAKGERITAAPLCARVYEAANERSLRLTLDNSFAIPFSELRAFTFNTPMRIRTVGGEEFEVDEGGWWFLVNNGRADSWIKAPEPLFPIDRATATVITSKQILNIDVAARDPLALGLIYGFGVGGAIAIVLFAIAVIR